MVETALFPLVFSGTLDLRSFCKASLYRVSGHHETPPEAHTKILETFPENFPRNQGNVIPPTTDKKGEEVCVISRV